MKKQYKLIALDLDGTLFDSESRISQNNKLAIKRAADIGVNFVIATGRPYQGLPLDSMAELGIRYAITTNGSAVYSVPEKECLFERCIPSPHVIPLIEQLQRLQVDMGVFIQGETCTPGPCQNVVEGMDNLPAALKEYILTTRNVIPDLVAYLENSNHQVQKVTMNFLLNEANTYVDRQEAIAILKNCPHIYFLSGGFGNLEFTAKGISKANGLTFLCDYLHIPVEQTLACGDSENDLDIIKAAGLGIAMENATDDIKAAADDITLSNDCDGVAALIEKWVL